jgi:hypothetical protein
MSRNEPTTLSTFPAELILRILKAFNVERDPKLDHLNAELDQITSVCLGLTCKVLYKIHKSLHPDPIKLHGSEQFPAEFSLATRLRSWMPSELVYNHVVEKFVTAERDNKINLEENRKDAERWKSISQARTMIMDAMQCSVSLERDI